MNILNYILTFIIGFFTCLVIFYVMQNGLEMPFGGSGNLTSPSDNIKDSQIHVYENAIVIDIKNAGIGHYASTGSMLPVLNENSTGIRIQVNSENDIKAGDIITFKQDNNLIIHRVISKGKDNEGVYFITKGDNSPASDGKIRLSQILYKTIGVLW